MSDVTEITALVNSYGLLLDQGDVDGVVGLFEHATWRSDPQGSALRGSDEVRPVYEQLLSSGAATGTKHLLTNLTVTVDEGEATASAHCYWTVLQNTGAGAPIDVLLSGQYTDRFEKVGGAWRFADRLITTDLFGKPSAG